MLKTFNCPKCGAPVNYEQDVIGANLTAQCPYCNSALSVPDEMRGRPAQVISHVNIYLRNTVSGGKAVRWILFIVLVPVVGVVIAAIAMGGFVVPLLSSTVTKTTAPVKSGSKGLGGKERPAGFASTTLQFGSEGIGPGMFKDARSIAVDAAGKIYVGEHSGGRVQVFDPEGKFITQWTVDPKLPLTGMAADRNGTVYIVQSGMISRYEGATGKLLGQVAYADGWGFDDLSSVADGGLVAAWYKNRDDIVRFNAQGQVTRTIPNSIRT
jgi:DNA-binding beta-propeller fold protein YncE